MYWESHRGSVAKAACELYCKACDRTLLTHKAGDMQFTQTHGSCTCSWSCCDAAKPGNKPHGRHLAYRTIQ